MKQIKKLVYMRDKVGNNLKVFASLLEASEYLNVDYYDILKHVGGLEIQGIPFKFVVKEVRDA